MKYLSLALTGSSHLLGWITPIKDHSGKVRGSISTATSHIMLPSSKNQRSVWVSKWVTPKKEWLGQRHGHKFSLRHNSTRFREAIGPWFWRKTPTYVIVHCPHDLRSQELFLLQFYRHSKNVIDSWLFWSEMTWSTKLILTFLYFWEFSIETLWG